MSAAPSIGLGGTLLSEAFPFHFALDRSLTVVQAGAVIERMCGALTGRRLGEKLSLVAPQIEQSFEAMRDQARTLFMYRIAPAGQLLKGQVVYEPESDHLLFLGSPWITDVARLSELGLTLRDFAPHDPLADLLFLIQAKNAALMDAKRLAMKLTEQTARLRDEERRYRNVVNAVREAIFQADIEGRLTFLNPAWTAMTGFSVEESLGRSGFDFVHPDDRELNLELYSRMLGNRDEDGRGALRFVTRTGGVRWLEVCARLSTDDQDRPTGIIGTLDDITERKLAEEAQARARDELARTSRLKDEFLANMSHELRTPLNSILGLTEALLEEAYGPVNERQATFLSNIEESGRHLLTLINDILDLSKVEAGTLGLELHPVAPADVCSASLRMVKQTAARKKQRLSLRVEEGVPEVLADERRLKQVLVNLLSNAVKFTPEGGSIGLDVTFDGARSAVSFAVWDTGIGISPEGMTLLFRPFVQLDGGLARKHEGAGLGLALVYRLTELQNGSVTVESAEGRGSRFTVRVPALDPVSTDAAEASMEYEECDSVPPGARALPGSGRFTVLLAEDNELNVQTLMPYLQHAGYRVELARDGFEAVSAAQSTLPDLVLMDVQMPRMDGLEAIRRIRTDERLAGVPIIALTALAMPGDRDRCLSAGADDYVSKPFRLRRLVSLVRKHIQERPRPPQPKDPMS